MQSDKRLLRTILYLHFRLERAQKKLADTISLSQYRLLYLIQRGPARSVELATASGMTKPSIGALVNQLEEKRWIKRKPVASDKRAASIVITSAGNKAITEFQETMQNSLQEFLGEEAMEKSETSFAWLDEIIQVKRKAAHEDWAKQ